MGKACGRVPGLLCKCLQCLICQIDPLGAAGDLAQTEQVHNRYRVPGWDGTVVAVLGPDHELFCILAANKKSAIFIREIFVHDVCEFDSPG